MKQISELIKRNFKLYIRDKNAVFFSFLTMLIIIVLMLVFLGDMNIQAVVNLLEEMGVSDLDTGRENAQILVLMWTIAGVVSINTVTISLSIIGIMIQDMNNNRLQSFYTAPISRIKIALGYIGAAWLGSIIICILTLFISEGLAVLNGATMLSAIAHLKIIGMIAVNAFTYSAAMYFIALFVKTESAWSGFGTIVGTLAGFLGAIYLPMGGLPDSVQSFLKCTPILHSVSMFRSVFTETICTKTFDGLPKDITNEYNKAMGITVSFGDKTLTAGMQAALILICGVILLVAAGIVMKKKSVSDR